MPNTTTRVVVVNVDILSHANEMEQLLVLSFMRDIQKNLLSIERAQAEIHAILSKYADGQKVFEETLFSKN